MRNQGFLREHSSVLVYALWLLDMLAMLVCAKLCFTLVFGWQAFFPRYVVAISMGLLLASVFFYFLSLYRAWRGRSRLDELRSIAIALGLTFITLVLIAFLSKTTIEFSRVWTTTWFVSSLISIACMRAVVRTAFGRMRRKGFNLRQVVVLGGGVTGIKTREHLHAIPEEGFELIGYFSDDPEADVDGSLAQGLAFIADRQVDQVWIAMYLSEEDRIRDIMSQLKDSTADIRLVPGVFGMHLLNHSISDVGGLSVINLSISPMDGVNRILKAFEDKLIASLILILASPLMLMIALAVRLSSPGPIFYSQQRVSWNNRPFNIYKFRSMPVDVEQASGAVWASANEQRATRLGAFLRKTSLDELPQFWNVLKGDMSIVGPRPERPEFVARFKDEIPGYMQKHKVKGGITGWAQVNGWRGDTDLNKRIEHDLYYIENWSVWFDLKIIALTLKTVLGHKNAY